MKTVALERKAVAGGGLSTLEDLRHPGFLHNTHATGLLQLNRRVLGAYNWRFFSCMAAPARLCLQPSNQGNVTYVRTIQQIKLGDENVG